MNGRNEIVLIIVEIDDEYLFLFLLFIFWYFKRIILELNQNLRIQVEQAIYDGKRLYTPDNKDSSGVESAGKCEQNTNVYLY